jgi:hypothetical protein
MVGCNKSNCHRKEQAGSNETWRCRRGDIEKTASRTDYKAKKQSYDRSDHCPFLNMRNSRSRSPTNAVGARISSAAQ